MNLQKWLELVQIGNVILDKAVYPRLEAFLENAIYYRRGMPTMNKYKTVKEVCDLTGLTRKHLYYFHHEGVVRAVAYANYSVEGNDGYKLYDDTAVEKLQQISLYYQIGLKRDEIKAIMQDPEYDSNKILHTLLTLEREKKLHTERMIAALEYLTATGTSNEVSALLRKFSLKDLGRTLLDIRQTAAEEGSCHIAHLETAEKFVGEFERLIAEFGRMDDTMLGSSTGICIIRQIFDLSDRYLGADSIPFLMGLFMSVWGEGTGAQEIRKLLTPTHGRAIVQYMIEHPQLFQNSPHTKSDEDKK